MEEHRCIQEHKLGQMEGAIARMEKDLYNGNGGLVKNVPVLCRNVEALTESVDDLRATIKNFSTFTNEYEGGKQREEEIKKTSFRTWQYISTFIGAIVGLIAILSFVLTLSINKQQNEKFDKVDREMYWKQDREPSPVTRGGDQGTPMDTTAIKKLW